MANKLIKRNPNNLLKGRNHYFKFGDFLFKPDASGNVTNRSMGNMSPMGEGLLKAGATTIGQLGGSVIGGGLLSGAGNVLQGLSGIASAIPGPWGAVACLCEGLRVITRGGRFVNIEDLTPEDGIIGFSEQTNSIAPQTTTLQMLELYKPCIRIELQSGLNLECSTDHPVYIADSGRATRKYVDGIRTRVKTYSYVKAGDIKTGQYAGVIDEVPIFGNLNVEKAYLIGMLIGDGSYTKRSIVALHTGDKDTWDYVESNNYGVVVNRFDSGEKYSKEFRTYRITNGCQMMGRLGLYGQSKCTKTLPNNIHLWNKESIANLIAGLWDTDGYVTIESNGKKKHRICFCQSNLSLIRAVQEQLIKFGIHSSIKINKPKKSVIKDKQVNSKEAYVLIIKDKKSCMRFIENIHLNISYKQRNLDRIKEITKAKFTKDNSFRQGVHADKVISVTPIGVQRIYNLEAHQDHNYIANFIVTHNSAGLGLIGGLTNRMFGSKLNEENIAQVEANIDLLKTFQSNASTFDSLQENWSNSPTAMTFSDDFIGTDGWFSNKASDKADELRALIEAGKHRVQSVLNTNALNIGTTLMLNLLANYTAFGGDLMIHGANFDTGVTLVGNGGTHEQNPNEGVPMGVDLEGVPNLVEEGEVIFNDYVFSKRLKVPKAVRNKYKLRGNKSLTFADAALLMAKESEERPNDPISLNGLEALLGELAFSQESIRESKNLNKHANGGKLNKYDWGSFLLSMANYSGSKTRSNLAGRYAIDNKTFGTRDLIRQMEQSKDYIDWSNYVLNNPTNPNVVKYLLALDAGVADSADRLYNSEGNLNSNWQTLFKNRRGIGAESAQGQGGIYHFTPDRSLWDVRPYDVEPLSIEPLTDLEGNVIEPRRTIPEFDPLMRNEGISSLVLTPTTNTNTVTDTGEYPDYDNWMRYMPVVGSAIGLGTSLFSKPDFSEAQAVLEASRNSGRYSPVRYNPIGNYLTYRPFDRDYYTNKLNAEASAARRAIANTSGGNRAQAMAGILAADYNAQGKLGDLFRQAEEYNLAQRLKVEEFNRGTNILNSQGFLQADIANQNAAMKARSEALSGALTAAEMRNRAKMAREQAISGNFTNLFNSIGDIGKELVDRKWRTWAAEHGVYAPVQKAAKGGKLKRKRGLTF